MSDKLTYENAVTIIRDKKCKPNFDKDWFSENYKDKSTDMPLICSCGETFKIKLSSIRAGSNVKMCRACTMKTMGKKSQMTYANMVSFIKSNSCKPLFDKKWFKDNFEGVLKTNLKIRCKCGADIEKKYNTFQKSPQCNACGLVLSSNATKLLPDEIINSIKATGCKPTVTKKWLKENYTGIFIEMSYICSCGETFTKSLNSFKNYPRCSKCAKEQGVKTRGDTFEDVTFFVRMCDCKIGFNEEWFEKNYRGSKTIIPIVCKCGTHTETRYSALKYWYQSKALTYKCDTCRAIKSEYKNIDYMYD